MWFMVSVRTAAFRTFKQTGAIKIPNATTTRTPSTISLTHPYPSTPPNQGPGSCLYGHGSGGFGSTGGSPSRIAASPDGGVTFACSACSGLAIADAAAHRTLSPCTGLPQCEHARVVIPSYPSVRRRWDRSIGGAFRPRCVYRKLLLPFHHIVRQEIL